MLKTFFGIFSMLAEVTSLFIEDFFVCSLRVFFEEKMSSESSESASANRSSIVDFGFVAKKPNSYIILKVVL